MGIIKWLTRLQGPLAFGVGVLLGFLPKTVGRIHPHAYDDNMLPLLHHGVLPYLIVPALVAACLLLWRTEEGTMVRMFGLVIAGGVFGLLIDHDWWYRDWGFLPPLTLCGLAAVAVWRIQMMEWSRGMWAGGFTVIVCVPILLGAWLDTGQGIEMDPRFGPGIPGGANVIFSVGVPVSLIGIVGFWAWRIWLGSERRNRRLLGRMIEEEPRCAEFFESSARITAGIPKLAEGFRRRPPCAARLRGRVGHLFPETKTMASPLLRPFNRLAWRLGWAAARTPGAVLVAELLRKPWRGPGFPSIALRSMLREASTGAARNYVETFAGLKGDGPYVASRPAKEDWSVVNRHFAVWLTLREAEIEADFYANDGIPDWRPEDWSKSLDKARERLLAANLSDGGRQPGKPDEVELEYVRLWLENAMRIIVQQGDELAGSGAAVDLALLTETLMASRRLRSGAPGVHGHAAVLALGLFRRQAGEDGAAILERRYFDFLGRLGKKGPLSGRPLEGYDKLDAVVAAAAYALHQASLGRWHQARKVFALEAVHHALDSWSQFRRFEALISLGEAVEAGSRSLLVEALGMPLIEGMVPDQVLRGALGAKGGGSMTAPLAAALANHPFQLLEVTEVSLRDLDEMPRFPIRQRLAWQGVACLAVGVLVFWVMNNPVERIRDPRLGTSYDSDVLTSMAAGRSADVVWVGTRSSGVRVYEPDRGLFRRDINVETTGGELLADRILDLDFSPKGRVPPLAAITLNDREDGGGAVQLATAHRSPQFWARPVIDLSRFRGVSDETASCVAGSADGARLFVGTFGHGLGVYDVPGHSWIGCLTTANGLPSDHVVDVATRPDLEGSAIWIATDGGLSLARLDGRGIPGVIGSYRAEDGLPGSGMKELMLGSSHLWFRSDGDGLGRIAVDELGFPANGQGPELLISERKFEDLRDDAIVLAAGAPSTGRLWFLGGAAGNAFAGRYSELPRDVAGMKVSFDPASLSVCDSSVDASDGRRWLLGTRGRGALLFAEAGVAPGQPPLPEVAGGFAGLDGRWVPDVALADRLAVARTMPDEGSASSLWVSEVGSGGGAGEWSVLVGDGRFPQVSGVSDITAVAASPAERKTWFGTKSDGIGVWDRGRMEMSQAYSSRHAQPERRLRHDTTLDLAPIDDGLVQVTGDHGADVVGNGGPFELIPVSQTKLSPGSVTAATAQESRFACAGMNRIGTYDAETFRWKDIDLPGRVASLDFTSHLLWARLTDGGLTFTESEANAGGWRTVETGVRSVAASPEVMMALARGGSGGGRILRFDGETGKGIGPEISCTPLLRGGGDWTIGIERDGVLFLAGTEGLDAYSLTTRSWSRNNFPAVRWPLRDLVATSGALWMIDSGNALHRFHPEAGEFKGNVRSGVEQVTAWGDRVLVLQQASPGTGETGQPRLVEIDESLKARTIIGRPLAGSFDAISDAVLWQDQLLIANGEGVSGYRWSTHDWYTLATAIGRVKRFHSTESFLWVETDTGLFGLSGNGFLPVRFPDGVVVRKVESGENGLVVLDGAGAVWEVAPMDGFLPVLRMAASRFPGGNAIAAERTAVVDDALVVLGGGTLLQFTRDADGLSHWNGCQIGGGGWTGLRATPDGRILMVDDGAGRASLVDRSQDPARMIDCVPPGQVALSVAVGGGHGYVATRGTRGAGMEVWATASTGGSPEVVIGPGSSLGSPTAQVLAWRDGMLVRRASDGMVTSYVPEARSWSGLDSLERADEIWVRDGRLFALDRRRREFRRLDRPTDSAVRIEADEVTAFPDGFLIRRQGEVRWIPEDGGVVGPAAAIAGDPPASFGMVKGVAAVGGGFAAMDGAGGICGFNPAKLRWEVLTVPAASGFLQTGNDSYVERKTGGRRLLHRLFESDDGGLGVDRQFAFALCDLVRHGKFSIGLTDPGRELVLIGRGNRAVAAPPDLVPQRLVPAGDKLLLQAGDGWHDLGSFDRVASQLAGGGFPQGSKLEGPVRPEEPVTEPETPPEGAGEGEEAPGVPPEDGDAAPAPDGPVTPRPTVPVRLPIEQVVVREERIYARIPSGRWFRLDGADWVEVEAAEVPAAPDRPVADPKGCSGPGWAWRPGPGDPNRFTLRLGTAELDVVLGAGGFGFEKVLDREVVGRELWAYTPVGALVYSPDGDGRLPVGLIAALKLPAPDAKLRVAPGGDSCLLESAGRFWRRDGRTGWREVPAADARSLEIPGDVLLENDDWKWSRSGGDAGVEAVEFKVRGLQGSFDIRSGRFGWDHCLGMGASGDEVWLNTKAGLFRVSGRALDLRSWWSPAGGTEALKFLDSGAGLPGALVDSSGDPAFVHADGEWRLASATEPAQIKRLETWRWLTPSWRIARDGRLVHAFSAQDGRWSRVSIGGDGRWDFETVRDLALADRTIHLALEAGMGAMRSGNCGLKTLDPGQRQVTRLMNVDGKLLAAGADGVIEWSGNGWKASDHGMPSIRPVEESADRHFRLERRFPGVSLTLVGEGGETLAVRSAPQGFAFDQTHAGQPGPDGRVFVSTDDGFVEIDRQGDRSPVKVEGRPARGLGALEIWRIQRGQEQPQIVALPATGSPMALDEAGWHPLAQDRLAEMDATRRATIVHGPAWWVTRGSPFEFRLRTPDCGPGSYKRVEMDFGRGLFTFDDFTELARPGLDGSFVIGSAGGLQRIDPVTGALLRLWCDPEMDGVGLDEVSGMTRGESDELMFKTAKGYHRLPTSSSRVETGNRSDYERAASVQAADPRGWRVEIHPEGGSGMKTWWKSQPTFLVPSSSGSRFAHNVVHSVHRAGRELVIGTAGGIVTLTEPTPEALKGFSLVSKVFLTGDGPPEALVWIGGSGDKTCLAGDSVGGFWRFPPNAPGMAKRVLGVEAADARSAWVAEDDLVRWQHPGAGVVKVAFQKGKVSPETLEPEIVDGSFAFAQLERPGAELEVGTALASTPGEIAWVTRAGVLRFDSRSRMVRQLHSEFGGRVCPRDSVSAVQDGMEDPALFATVAGRDFRWDAFRWAEAERSPAANSQRVALSASIECRKNGSGVAVSMRHSDDPDARVFVDGRAAVDAVHGLALSPLDAGRISLATDAGVARMTVDAFDFSRLDAQAFPEGDPSSAPHPVGRIAAARTDGQDRLVAVADGGANFEWSEAGWQSGEGTAEVFTAVWTRVNRPKLWKWIQYPEGLQCEFLATNGRPLLFGKALDPESLPIFSREKLSIDDARGAALGLNNLMVRTPVGIARFALDESTQTASLLGLDVWAGGELMLNLEGLSKDVGFTCWSRHALFYAAGHDTRRWNRLKLDAEEFRNARIYRDRSADWLAEVRDGDARIRLAGGLRRSIWASPVRGSGVLETGLSDHGLWLLTERELVRCDPARVRIHPRHWVIGAFGRKRLGEP